MAFDVNNPFAGWTNVSSIPNIAGQTFGGKLQSSMIYLGRPAAQAVSVTYSAPVAPQATPVTPTIDPKLEANALYGKPMALSVGGYYRMGASPAPIVGPYISGGTVDMIVSFGVPANVEGDRKIYKIYLDNELAWSSAGGGTLPGDGTFAAEAFGFVFKPGTLTQTICSLETAHFPGDECAYRPQMLLEITGLPYARFMQNTGKPVPYVACEIGDVTDGADPLDFINLGEALERIAFSPWAGYDAGTFEWDGITDMVEAILIKDNFTIVQLCQTVTREYRNIDLILSDKVRIRDRGSSVVPDFVFNRDSIIGGDGALSVTRAGATAQRREHELIAIDPDQDYTMVPSLSKIPRDPMVISAAVGKETITTPLVIDADTRQALATFSQQYEENARKKVGLKVSTRDYGIEPGDLFAVTDIADGFDNEVFKCTHTTHGANWVVEIEGEAILRCSIYGDDFDPYLLYVVLLLGFGGADGSTTVTDESPAVHGNATVVGTAQVDTAQSKFGGSSLLTDATSDADGISWAADTDWDLSDANSDQFTVEAWVRPNTATPTDSAIVACHGGGVPNLAFMIYVNTTGNGELQFLGSTTGGAYDWATVASSGIAWSANTTWYHVAADKDATGKVRLYRDGVMLASATPSNSAMHNAVAGVLSVGANGPTGGRTWPGWIDEVRITKGIARYASDAGYTVPTAAFPRT